MQSLLIAAVLAMPVIATQAQSAEANACANHRRHDCQAVVGRPIGAAPSASAGGRPQARRATPARPLARSAAPVEAGTPRLARDERARAPRCMID